MRLSKAVCEDFMTGILMNRGIWFRDAAIVFVMVPLFSQTAQRSHHKHLHGSHLYIVMIAV